MLPRTSYYVEMKMDKEFRAVSGKALEFVTVLAIPLTVGFTIMAKQCILFLSGNAYLPSVTPMRVIMPTLILIGASNVFGVQMLVPLGREKLVLYSECAGAVTDIILNAICIPKYGAAGAAFGTVMAEAVVLIVQVASLKDVAIEIIQKLEIWKIILSVMAAGAVMELIQKKNEIGTFLMLIVCFAAFWAIYGLMLFIFRERVLLEILETIKHGRKKIGE